MQGKAIRERSKVDHSRTSQVDGAQSATMLGRGFVDDLGPVRRGHHGRQTASPVRMRLLAGGRVRRHDRAGESATREVAHDVIAIEPDELTEIGRIERRNRDRLPSR